MTAYWQSWNLASSCCTEILFHGDLFLHVSVEKCSVDTNRGCRQEWHPGCALEALVTLEHHRGYISSYSSATPAWLFLFQKAIVCFLLHVSKLKINWKKHLHNEDMFYS